MNEDLKNKFEKMCKYFGMTEAEFNDIVFHAMEKQSKPNSEQPLYNTNDRLFDADLNKQWMEQQKERKLICEFEGYKYYEGDTGYYYDKNCFLQHSTELSLNSPFDTGFPENNKYSKIFPSAALRDAALEEYKKTKEREELLERAKREYTPDTKIKASIFSFEGIITGTPFWEGGQIVVYCMCEDRNEKLVIYFNEQWATILKPDPVIDFNYCLKEYKEKCSHDPMVDWVVNIARDMKDLSLTETKLHCIARELIVSTVLNGEAKEENIWYIVVSPSGSVMTTNNHVIRYAGERYASEAIALKAIEILGEDTIKRARV